jgi:hypothetical protein
VERANSRLVNSRRELDRIKECIKLVKLDANFPQALSFIDKHRKEYEEEASSEKVRRDWYESIS